MEIQYSILNILDFDGNMNLESTKNISIENNDVSKYILSYINKAFNDIRSKSGTFKENSKLKEMILEYKSNENFEAFLKLNHYLSTKLFKSLIEALEKGIKDLIFLKFARGDENYIGFILLSSKKGFTHRINNVNSSFVNEIVEQFALLPPAGGKSDCYAFINMEDLSILYTENKKEINGEQILIIRDKILEAEGKASPKEYVESIKEAAREVSEEFGQNAVFALSAVKNHIRNEFVESSYEEDETEVINITDSVNLDSDRLINDIFGENELMKESFIKKLENMSIPKEIALNKKMYTDVTRKHRLRLDNGIELLLPVQYLEDSEVVEFSRNTDGTETIIIKNVKNIESRN